ncbi:hypothetical protein [Methylophilus sp. OH31]|uniref:hypothetical protein n=1 Tax=Methylophilus sp. OH31 TaxID=1387312 RepID=UPI00046744CC|nr:hypothetical protein [Methylophilus sp. OH31]
MAETAKLIALLSNPQVRELIDFRKLKASDTLKDIAEFAAEHALASGDRTYISRVLDIFKNTKDFDRLLKWFCLRTALETTLIDGNLKFNKSDNAPNREIALRPFLNPIPTKPQVHKKSSNRVVKPIVENPAKKKKKKHKRIDLLDSWAMLPGSYGTGKRR